LYPFKVLIIAKKDANLIIVRLNEEINKKITIPLSLVCNQALKYFVYFVIFDGYNLFFILFMLN